MYLIYNALTIYLFVGKQTDPYYLSQIFKVNSFQSIDRGISEEEMFADVEQSAYLNTLYIIINQIRYQRQPFTEIKLLLEGDNETEGLVNQMMIIDNKNSVYQTDFQKFLGTITGGGLAGPGASAGGSGSTNGSVAGAVYY